MPLALPHMVAGLIAVLVGYTSSVVLIIQAATAAGADTAQVSSWLWTLGIGMGVSCIGLSLYYRVPVLTAWSTPGAALLITSLGNFSLAEAIGAFIISSLLITLCGISGWFDRLMRHIPAPLAELSTQSAGSGLKADRPPSLRAIPANGRQNNCQIPAQANACRTMRPWPLTICATNVSITSLLGSTHSTSSVSSCGLQSPAIGTT